VGEIAPGEVVGEMSIFTGEARSARVRALRASSLVSLNRAAFERLIARRPEMLVELTRLLIQRLRRAQSGSPAESPARIFAVIAPGPEVPRADFAHRRAAARAQLEPTLRISAADLDRHLATPGLAQAEPDDPAGARIASWIDEQEMRHRFVVLEADASASAWSARCVRHADRLVVIGRAGDDPSPGTSERALVGL